MAELISMQSKTLDAFSTLIRGHHLEAVHQPIHANTGTVYAQRGFETFLSIHYHFGADCMSLTVRGPAVDDAHLNGVPLVDSPPEFRVRRHFQGGKEVWYLLKYRDGQRIHTMLELLDSLLPTTPVLTPPHAQQIRAGQDLRTGFPSGDQPPLVPGDTYSSPQEPDTGQQDPLAERAARIVADFKARGLGEDAVILRERVFQMAQQMASDANNAGRLAQIVFLLRNGHREEDVREDLKDRYTTG